MNLAHLVVIFAVFAIVPRSGPAEEGSMRLFTLIHDPAGERVGAYDGMDQATVTNLINETGFTFEFIDETAYNAFIEAHQPVALTPEQMLAMFRAEAIEILNTRQEGQAKLFRAVVLLVLDEFNLLRERDRDRSADVAAATSLSDLKTRWAARGALAERTAAQLKAAIENRITDGSAD